MEDILETSNRVTPGLAAIAILVASGIAVAQPLKGEYVSMDAGRYDLLRAHNERIIVVFGQSIHFRRYYVVDMLRQHFTVATDIPEGVRYNLAHRGEDRMLVIE